MMEQPTKPVTDVRDSLSDTASERLSVLSSLLSGIDEIHENVDSQRGKVEAAHQNQLVQVRLGIASGLFAALRAKHQATANHCLRVALGCSSWSMAMEITNEQRDEIEVAALLHDLGKVGVPDHILLKAAKLTPDERDLIELHRQQGIEILMHCASSDAIIDIVHYCSARYDGSREGFDCKGDKMPLGARMVAIVDAFDSMTTDHVYRRAMSRERALAELFECAGGQFDPDLVKDFGAFLGQADSSSTTILARRWLRDLHAEASNALWSRREQQGEARHTTTSSSQAGPSELLFQDKLVENMQDGVIFVDRSCCITLWNLAAERLTGIPSDSVCDKRWTPSLLELCDQANEELSDDECPVAEVIQSGEHKRLRLNIRGRGKKQLSVDVHIVPVHGVDGVVEGATIILHDASSQVNLEARVETLETRASQDPLTKVANRAEFDRVFKLFVSEHLEKGLPCALIIADLDFFKRINDTFGHQAGDQAIISFAKLLKRFHREGDLVARYGGEEFVMLCADCDNATATRRAEELRTEFESLHHSILGGQSITASFGVTEIQAGDTPETMLRRSDRALLRAKDMGRNRVVQLGSGIADVGTDFDKSPGWLSIFKSHKTETLIERHLVTPVPLKLVAEKLRGFVADHHAEVVRIEEEEVILKIDGHANTSHRRRSDRPVPFAISLRFEEAIPEDPTDSTSTVRTTIQVMIRPIRLRDRRHADAMERARQLLVSLKSYLIASDHHDMEKACRDTATDAVIRKAKEMFGPIFGK